jgi:hypothetical protein
MQTAAEGSVDIPAFVAILFEDVPQEHQLGLQAVFITELSGSVYQSGKYRLFLGWVIMGLGFKVEFGVCGLAVHFVSQRAIRSSENIQVQEWEVAFTFSFHGQLKGMMDAV